MRGNSIRGVILQERDWRILRALKLLRFLDRNHTIAIGPFHSVTRANARINQLVQAGLLEALPVGTILGGRKLVYQLSRKGAELVGVVYRPLRRDVLPAISGDPFLEHQLEINKVYVTVNHRPIPIVNVACCRWLAFFSPPVSNLPLIPDAYFELTAPAGDVGCFLEVDMGTEPPKVWQKKISLYLQLAVSKDFEKQFGRSRFRVLVVTTTGKRLKAIATLIRRSTDRVFWLSTFEQLQREGFWSAVWHRPTGDQPQALL
jgi:hypothetical protein